MKFMKLGIKPDTFQGVGNIRSVALEIASDFIVHVDGVTFHLHKFPLVSKSTKLHRLSAEAHEKDISHVVLNTFPGGVEPFEICIKFCYGIKITLNAYNVVAVRCAAEELEMTESAEKGNLVSKVEAFLNSYIFHGWKDSIIAFRSTQSLLPLAEELQLVSRCVNSIASKAVVNPAKVDWSFTQTRSKAREPKSISEIAHSPPWNGNQTKQSHPVQIDWWIEDIAELDVNLYVQVFLKIKAKDGIQPRVLGEALQFYTFKWLPGLARDNYFDGLLKENKHETANFSKERHLLERIIAMLPPDKGSNSCNFLLKVLKAAIFFGIALPSRKELIRRVGLQLEEASLKDLLIPYFPEPDHYLYDIETMESIVDEFMMQDQSPPTSPKHEHYAYVKRRTKSAENINIVESRRSNSATHGSKLRVSKLIDGYLAEIAIDPQLELSRFMALAKSVPNFTRPLHDGLYRAIDIYLKKHPGVSKGERKKLCRLLDCKKLSMDACMHAAQNERLPLRTVVQVLFFEQVRAAMNGGGVTISELPTTLKALMAVHEGDSREGTSGGLDDKWEEVQQNFEILNRDLANMKIKLSEVEKEHSVASNTPTKSKKFFSKLWPGKTFSDGKKSLSMTQN
ncbi:hypothetical protein KP509_11G059700 [Ceratopteris richardii]|uniref:Uncharacterized protein n=1 Tax=Ceratopteris richardii TaxID=49495 RepID=A0A8T2TPU5_CERRI|nr:hypothetical protein KP509_11G059700 [Ceratopteris richardii]KAH7425543.1 hypothetical protein KP509_11G059700 [Ceratopteris richardii]